MRGRQFVGAIALACVGLTGCDRLSRLGQGGSDSKVPATQQECVQFAADLQAAVDANDQARAAKLIGLAEPYKTAVGDFEGTPEYRKGLLTSCDEHAAKHPF